MLGQISKKEVRDAVTNRPAGKNIVMIVPPMGCLDVYDIHVRTIFPPQLEDYVTDKQRNVIIEQRSLLDKELRASHVFDGYLNSNNTSYTDARALLTSPAVLAVTDKYLVGLYTLLGGQRAVLAVFDKVPYIQETRRNLDHNIAMQHKMREYQERVCPGCLKTGPWNAHCGQCKETRYCSAECQKIDWPAHKKTCKKKE